MVQPQSSAEFLPDEKLCQLESRVRGRILQEPGKHFHILAVDSSGEDKAFLRDRPVAARSESSQAIGCLIVHFFLRTHAVPKTSELWRLGEQRNFLL